ncbi:MAG: DUF1697 domain-containing protein [Streptosporangiaceae bacterium]
MTKYVALLRGINVGGHNKVPMADLREVLSGLGYTDVSTLLQSGNAVFAAPGRTAGQIATAVEAAITERFGLTIRTLVRSADELRAVVEDNPMEVRDPQKFLVLFLHEVPAKELLDAIDTEAFQPEEMIAGEREIYVYHPEGMQNAKLVTHLGKRLAMPTTGRNWNTVTKLLALVSD